MFKLIHPSLMVSLLTDKLRLYNFRARLASAVLYKEAKKRKGPLEYIRLTNDVFRKPPLKYVGWSIRPSQVTEEIQTLLTIVQKLKVSRMLEIGTNNGGTLFLFARMVDPNAKILSLDLPGGEFGGGYEKFKIPFFTNFAQGDQKIFLLRADSHLQSSLRRVEATLGGRELDSLFIDGDHTYSGVKKDFEMYSPLVRKGGLIAFHDVCQHPSETGCDVYSFWNQIKHSYRYREIVKDPCQNWAGIGLIYT